MGEPQVQRLDPLSLPLFGQRLIEASAGTGKTYTLVILYLRLLLGLGGPAAFPQRLSVDEILVVTFTEAATEELRGRIRDSIHTLRVACLRQFSEQPLLAQLLTQISDYQAAAALLLAAERQMDDAAIYTIHGFCQRILTQNAFESGILFEQTLIKDELTLRRQATADFWRRHCYPLPLGIAQMVNREFTSPEALLSALMPYLQGDTPQLLQAISDEDLLARHERLIGQIVAVKQAWLKEVDQLTQIITDSDINKRSYSARYLPQWIEQVTTWAEEETINYLLPKALEKFRQSELHDKTKGERSPQHPLFARIEQLYLQPLGLRDLLLAKALSEIRISIQREKRQRAEQGFDDLLSRLDQALARPDAERLAIAIRQRYPVAMIDEFQDTDPQQYRIFSRVYGGCQETGLLLIGDPKQAIYAFRGADIFTYMQARQQVTAHYTLETNWRSSAPMVQNVNHLFQQLANPFIFSGITFQPVQAAESANKLIFSIDQRPQPAMQLWLQEQPIGISDYQQLMARQCAAQIRDWLTAGQQQRALLQDAHGRRAVTAADIAILVRTGKEAALVRDALSALGIASVYLSNRESVFATQEAQDLLWLLQAVLTPENDRALRSALASSLLGLSASQLDSYNGNEQQWDILVAEFSRYREHWLKRGILPMLQELILTRHLGESLLAREAGERRLTDLLHIGELLQEAAQQQESEHALVRWLAQQIAGPDHQAESQQMRLESDRHLVKVVTIHKSKGLEYPLVWLPFICYYRPQTHALYHDRQDFRPIWDLQESQASLQLAEEERLAEDLRLLYVALTRSIYHCSIGVAPIFSGNRTQANESDLHKSAIGHLLQRGSPADAATLRQRLTSLSEQGIRVKSLTPPDSDTWNGESLPLQELAARHFQRTLYHRWQVTSYSGLQHHAMQEYDDYLLRVDSEVIGEASIEPSLVLSRHSFPKGAAAGTFLHSLFETMDFTQPIDSDWLVTQLAAFNLGEEWAAVLQEWLEEVLHTRLNEQGLSLNQIDERHRLIEMQFYLPIRQLIDASQFDQITQRYDPLSATCPPLNFTQVQGMLKGFIDLVFCWQGRYYVVDYKSNWLGGQSDDYSAQAVYQAMTDHRYDLQYQLYTLALHRYLRHRLVDYDYQRHFGGVFYLFLRGMTKQRVGTGVFACRPEQQLVTELDRLFSSPQRRS